MRLQAEQESMAALGANPQLMPQALASAPRIGQANAAATGGGGGIGQRLKNFVKSDEALGLAAGILSGGGTTAEALGRGFSNMLAIRMADKERNAKEPGLTFDQRMQLAKAGRDYTIPQIEKNWEVAPTTEGGWRAQPIPGGPADIEQQELAAQNERRQQRAEADAFVVRDEISRAIGIVENNPAGTTGWGGAIFGWMPASQANALREKLDPIAANISFEKLQAMRDNKTGGALGQVSNFENQLLQRVYGSLAQTQNPDDLLYNLRRLDRLYSGITGVSENSAQIAEIGRAVDAGEMKAAEAEARIDALLSQTQDEVTTLPNGVRITRIR